MVERRKSNSRRRVKILKELTKEQQKELKLISAEIEAEAIRMRIDYEDNPSEESGSVVVVHQESEFLKEIKEDE